MSQFVYQEERTEYDVAGAEKKSVVRPKEGSEAVIIFGPNMVVLVYPALGHSHIEEATRTEK